MGPEHQPLVLRWECGALGGQGAGVQAPQNHKGWFRGLVGKQSGWLRDHGGHLTWVLMTGHLLVLRIQWPQRRSSFPKLHVQVLSSPRGCYSHTALFLSLASRVVAAAAAAATVGVHSHTQTLGSWGLAPRTTRDLSFSRVRYLWRLVLKSIPFKC